MKYPLAVSTWDDRELKAIMKVIINGRFTMGNYVKKFENEFANFIGRKYAVMVSSGSAANLLGVASLFYTKEPYLHKGDEVIVPAISWSTTYFPLQQYGLRLKFVDVDIETLNYDLDALYQAITDKTKMIIVVNLLGNPNDFNKINEIVKDRDIIIFEDNCESMGAEYNGKQTGTFGIIGTFSTFFSHHISTMEGGFVTTDDEELYHIFLSMRAHGWTRDLPKENKVYEKSDDWFEESFKFVLPGYNLRPVEMSGAIGLEQLNKLPKFIEQRRKNAELFQDLFGNDDRFILQKEIGKSSWFGFSLIIREKSGFKRKEIIKKLFESGIECRPIVAGNFVRNPVMKYFDYEIFGELKNADYIHQNGFFVGNSHINLTNEIEYLKNILDII